MTSARTNRENICDECGLPISICNAKAMFEHAVRRNGREAVIAAILDDERAENDRLRAALRDVIGCDHHNFCDGGPPKYVRIARDALAQEGW